jgi:hypothetical protein
MNKLKVKTEYHPIRCEICHQSDCFNPISNECERCKETDCKKLEIITNTSINDPFERNNAISLIEVKNLNTIKNENCPTIAESYFDLRKPILGTFISSISTLLIFIFELLIRYKQFGGNGSQFDKGISDITRLLFFWLLIGGGGGFIIGAVISLINATRLIVKTKFA